MIAAEIYYQVVVRSVINILVKGSQILDGDDRLDCALLNKHLLYHGWREP